MAIEQFGSKTFEIMTNLFSKTTLFLSLTILRSIFFISNPIRASVANGNGSLVREPGEKGCDPDEGERVSAGAAGVAAEGHEAQKAPRVFRVAVH